MADIQSGKTPLARLVLFICCLAIAGSVVAGLHYYAVDLPAQKNVPAPENSVSSTSNCEICKHNCRVDTDYYACLAICNDLECS